MGKEAEVTAAKMETAAVEVAEEATATAMVAAMEAKEVAVETRAEAQAVRPLGFNGWGQKAEGPPEVEKTTASVRGSALHGMGVSKGHFFRR